METIKAGCILVDVKHKKIGLIYRDKFNDYSFPKGHLEQNETIEECAIRETAEETKRDCKIVSQIKPDIQKYTTPRGEKCACYMYVAVDSGASDNASTDTHDLVWVKMEDVEQKLSYENLKILWNKKFPEIINTLY